MEYVNQGSLNHFLQNSDPKPSIQTLKNLAHQALCGMEYLESKQVIHCDLAARNLLVKKLPQGELIAKVSDFGMGKILQSSSYYVKNYQLPSTFSFCIEILTFWD
jgi:serine/threonine protein kinase